TPTRALASLAHGYATRPLRGVLRSDGEMLGARRPPLADQRSPTNDQRSTTNDQRSTINDDQYDDRLPVA
ncbi:MAG TPA: hypothetical protein VLV48_05545, partial [Thermoanaerobaculia bacterium]|nr:hypothetical protein [Thermoanaerobaculia bacterium]